MSSLKSQKAYSFYIVLLTYFASIVCCEVFLVMDQLQYQDLLQYSPYFFEGETITYILQTRNFDTYYFYFIAQDQGNCSKFSTNFMVINTALSQDDSNQEEICTQQMLQEYNACKFQLQSNSSILKITIKCISKSCLVGSNFIIEKEPEKSLRQINIKSLRPIFEISYYLHENKQNTQYLLIYSYETIDLIIEKQENDCIRINRQQSFQFILEISNQFCSQKQINILFISKCNSFQFSIVELLKLDILSIKDNILTPIFIIGQCYINYKQTEYKLKSNIFYKWRNEYNPDQVKYVCEKDSTLLTQSIMIFHRIEERFLDLSEKEDSSFQIRLYVQKHVQQFGICFHFQQQNQQIYYPLNEILHNFNKEDIVNSKEIRSQFLLLQKDSKGNRCIDTRSLYDNQRKIDDFIIIIKEKGIFEYEYQSEIIFFNQQRDLFELKCLNIKQNEEPLQIKEEQNGFQDQKITLKYGEQCQKIYWQTTFPSQTTILDKGILINHIQIYQYLSKKDLYSYKEDILYSKRYESSAFSYKNNRNLVIVNLPKKLRNEEFIASFDGLTKFTVYIKDQLEPNFLIPFQFNFKNYFLGEKDMNNRYWKDYPLVIYHKKLIKEYRLLKNVFKDEIHIYNYNFNQKILISVAQLLEKNNTIYVNMQEQKIIEIETNFSYQIENISQQFYRITFKITQNNNENDQKVVLKTCCDQIFSQPIVVYFKYLYFIDSFLIQDHHLNSLYDIEKELTFIFCWDKERGQKQNYFRYPALYYARIQNKKELQEFYQSEKQTTLKKLNFTLKDVYQSIDEGSEICLILLENEQSKQQNTIYFQLSFILFFLKDEDNYFQEINLDIPYETLYINNAQNKIILIHLTQYRSFSYQIYYNCSLASSQFYSIEKQLKIKIRRNSGDSEKGSFNMQIISLNQQIKIVKLGEYFQLTHSEWIIFEKKKFIQHQLIYQGEGDNQNFQFDYWLTNYKLSKTQCSPHDEKYNGQIKIEGILNKNNKNIIDTNFKFIYLKASSGFKNENIKFQFKYYTEIKIVNKSRFFIAKQKLSYYLFGKIFSKSIFKIEYSNYQIFQLSDCSTSMQSYQHRQIIINEDKHKNNMFKYMFIYPQICIEHSIEDFQNNQLTQEQSYLCLQINQIEETKNHETFILQEEQIHINKLELNSIFSIQLNQQNNYQILEVEKVTIDYYYLYLEYQSDRSSMVELEFRYLENPANLQSFKFKENSKVQLFQMKNFQYIELYSYQSNTTLDLTLILYEKEFYFSDLYQNKMNYNIQQMPQLFLLSKLKHQSMMIKIFKESNGLFQEEKLISKSHKSLIFFGNKVNFTLKEIGLNVRTNKQFFFLEVLDNNINISIQRNVYFQVDSQLQTEETTFNHQFSESTNTFKFQISKIQNQWMKNQDLEILQKQQIYFIYSQNQYELMQEILLSGNVAEQNKNIVINREKILELRQINDEEYEVTTSYFQSASRNILKSFQNNQFLRIYIFLQNQSLMIPFSQIFKEPGNKKNQQTQQELECQFWIILGFLITILALFLIFFFKFKSLLKKVNVL